MRTAQFSEHNCSDQDMNGLASTPFCRLFVALGAGRIDLAAPLGNQAAVCTVIRRDNRSGAWR